MSLPNIESSYPTITVTLPITKQKVKVRPFLVKEEKVFLMLKEKPEIQEIAAKICDVIDSCSYGKVKSMDLPAPDVEYLFTQIRCLSKGETADLSYVCKAKVEKDGQKQECGTPVKYSIPLKDLVLDFPEGHTSLIPIENTTLSVQLRYPSMRQVSEELFKDGEPTDKQLFQTIEGLVECVIDTASDKVYDAFTREELRKFMDSLTKDTFDRIFRDFFEKMPALTYTIHFDCPQCHHKQDIPLRGLIDFF